MDKKVMSLGEVQEFVERNAYLIQNFQSRCVDGRYEMSADLPGVAKPGADAGTVMVAFGALNSLDLHPKSDEVIALVEELVGGPQKFQFHTDNHAEHDHADPGMGCGHLKQAKDDPAAYGLTQDQIDKLYAELPAVLEKGANQEVLQGSHGEQAVLVVSSETHSLNPKIGETQAFVYQKTHDEKIQETLARKLLHHFGTNNLDADKFIRAVKDAATSQLSQTLQRLAVGLPVYLVKIDELGQSEINLVQ